MSDGAPDLRPTVLDAMKAISELRVQLGFDYLGSTHDGVWWAIPNMLVPELYVMDPADGLFEPVNRSEWEERTNASPPFPWLDDWVLDLPQRVEGGG